MVPAGAHGPAGNIRNPIMILLGGMICFVYALFSMYHMLKELMAFRQKEDINLILLLIPPILFWTLPPKVLEAKQMAGVPNATVQSPILYLFLGLYFLPKDLNEAFQAGGGVPGGQQ